MVRLHAYKQETYKYRIGPFNLTLTGAVAAGLLVFLMIFAILASLAWTAFLIWVLVHNIILVNQGHAGFWNWVFIVLAGLGLLQMLRSR